MHMQVLLYTMTLGLGVIGAQASPALGMSKKVVTTAAEEPPIVKDSARSMSARVMHCYDGDTCRVKVEDRLWMNVRLSGIDAPEIKGRHRGGAGQPMGPEARDYLNAQIKDKVVRLEQSDLDAFNRPIVEIFLEQRSLNFELVEKGLAEAYRGKQKRTDTQRFLDAEAKARQAKLGVWGAKGYVSPSEYRRADRRKM